MASKNASSQTQKNQESSRRQKEQEMASRLGVALENKKGSDDKKVFDPKRLSEYSPQELAEMVQDNRLESGLTAENLRKFLSGDGTWADVFNITAQDAYAFAQTAYNLMDQGRFDDAKKIVEGLVLANPYDAYMHALLGTIYARQSLWDESIDEYTTSLSLDDKEISTRVNRAEVYLNQGDFLKALEDLKIAIHLDNKANTPMGQRAHALAAATASVLEEALRQSGVDLDTAMQNQSAVTGATALRNPKK